MTTLLLSNNTVLNAFLHPRRNANVINNDMKNTLYYQTENKSMASVTITLTSCVCDHKLCEAGKQEEQSDDYEISYPLNNTNSEEQSSGHSQQKRKVQGENDADNDMHESLNKITQH
jgi:hypothetical protein